MSINEQERQNFEKVKESITEEDIKKINAILNDQKKNAILNDPTKSIPEKIKKLNKYFNASFCPKVVNFNVQEFNQKLQNSMYIISVFSGNFLIAERIFHILYSYFANVQSDKINEKDKLISRKYYVYNTLNEDTYVSIPTQKGEVILFLAHQDATRTGNIKQIGTNALTHSEIIKRSDKIFYTQDLEYYIHLLYSDKKNNEFLIREENKLFEPDKVNTINLELDNIYNDQFQPNKKEEIPIRDFEDKVKIEIIAKYIKGMSPFEEKIDSYCYKSNSGYKILYEVPGFNIDVKSLKIETCKVYNNLFVRVNDVPVRVNDDPVRVNDDPKNNISFPVIKIENPKGINNSNPQITYDKGFLSIVLS